MCKKAGLLNTDFNESDGLKSKIIHFPYVIGARPFKTIVPWGFVYARNHFSTKNFFWAGKG